MSDARLLISASCFALCACSSSSSPPSNGAATDSGTTTDATPDATPSCSDVGQPICAVDLQGYVRNDTTGLASSAAFGSFKLTDVFAQGTQPYVFIYNVAFWCSPCKEATGVVISKLSANASKAMFVDLMVEGQTPTTPTTQADLDAWVTGLSVPYTTAFDADPAAFAIKSTLGIKETTYIVDRKTLKIVAKAKTANDALAALDALP